MIHVRGYQNKQKQHMSRVGRIIVIMNLNAAKAKRSLEHLTPTEINETKECLLVHACKKTLTKVFIERI